MKLAMFNDYPILVSNHELNRILGEFILRAIMYVLGFSFVYMTNNEFMQSYLALFGCPNIPHVASFSSELLDRPVFSSLLETKTVEGVKGYRLRYSYIAEVAARISPRVTVDPAHTFDEDLNKNVTQEHSVPPQVLAAIVDSFTEIQLAQVGKTNGKYSPSMLGNTPLQDFCRYIPLWYPVGQEPNMWASNFLPMSDGDLTHLRNQGRAGTLKLTFQQFGSLFWMASGNGPDRKTAYIILQDHSRLILSPINDMRVSMRREWIRRVQTYGVWVNSPWTTAPDDVEGLNTQMRHLDVRSSSSTELDGQIGLLKL
ncbi:hypothetical protein BGX27_011216 [Mortierella sp. AM989]|nr:hypothetical protein BGX27_011216 [Mortierella sp. AM989]